MPSGGARKQPVRLSHMSLRLSRELTVATETVLCVLNDTSCCCRHYANTEQLNEFLMPDSKHLRFNIIKYKYIIYIFYG
jgi:hypothetical protein